ncbi:MAG TPA: homocysteine S-methyltransferase family protein [Anaerolineae bacterium]|nr:homocysteine S-methyltransferase family protein [Anaerolineae bacterium]
MRAPILERLASGDVLVADGATGTMLQAAGLPTGMPGEAWVLERPEEIRKLHRAYVEAGSQLILTSTFGGTRARLKAAGLDPKVGEISRRAAELARQVAGDGLYVGGDIGPTGEMMPPLGKLTYELAVDMFAEQAEALAAGGVDCIYIETRGDLNEAKAAVEGAQQACDLPVFCTFSFDTHGRTGMGISPTQAAQAMSQMGVQATGANCGHAPEEVLGFLPLMHEAAPNAYLIAKPNAGIPRMVKRQFVYDADPARMANLALKYIELGASIIGACCGSSPDHITAIAAARP